MDITITAKDAANKAISGVTVTISQLFVIDKVKTTDANGIAVFTNLSLIGLSDWVKVSVMKSGYGSYERTVLHNDPASIVFVMAASSTTPPPPPPPGSGIWDNGRVGTSCTIRGQGSNGVYFYAINHDRNGYLTSFHRMDWDEAKRQAERIPSCFELPPPPPKTINDIDTKVNDLTRLVMSLSLKIEEGTGDKIAALDKIVNSLIDKAADNLKKIQTLSASLADIADRILDIEYILSNIDDIIYKKLLSLKDTIIKWVTDAFIDIIEKVLNTEVKK